MELFKSKESCEENFDSENNWKTAWPRMILEWHLFFRLSLGFVWKMLSLVGKHVSFYLKMSVDFLYFLFKWKGVKPTSMSNKICREWLPLTLPLSHKKKEGGAKT